jgi:VIT1/CCC1 family predicted Fe2+/Mn2+ transporter
VLGVGDGLIANVSLILGVAGASPNASAIRLAGVAGRLAGAFSMAAGELVSVKAHDDLVEHEIDVERDEIQSESDASSQPRTVPAACRPSTPTRWRAS